MSCLYIVTLVLNQYFLLVSISHIFISQFNLIIHYYLNFTIFLFLLSLNIFILFYFAFLLACYIYIVSFNSWMIKQLYNFQRVWCVHKISYYSIHGTRMHHDLLQLKEKMKEKCTLTEKKEKKNFIVLFLNNTNLIISIF